MPGTRRVFRSVDLVLSCEHGGNRVPERYRRLIPRSVLTTHRGHDPGALEAARAIAAFMRAPLLYSTVSRLLVELNRPLGHHQVFSAYSQTLAPSEREELLQSYYWPYWRSVQARVRRSLRHGRGVLHLSVHSFTPRLRGVRRMADIGLLFDPRCREEARFCELWRREILRALPRLRVRHNYPYRGTGEALTTSLRREHAGEPYLGIEIEINQRFPRGDRERWRRLRRLLVEKIGVRARFLSN